ncbi:hypothetical protein GA0061101_10940 [Rhizobium lusitanum]|uniref:Flippase-like domain-containing protein n=2 Tax=Rhizobium lusitanum TaxID=293958 RepID=A0A1C3W8P0_9HYPH|nr:hypothetical protein GA0061101_10940 [Rhizobium lusitanum]
MNLRMTAASHEMEPVSLWVAYRMDDTKGAEAPLSTTKEDSLPAELLKAATPGASMKFGVLTGWALGFLALGGLILFVLHFSDFRAFTTTLMAADPIWLVAAALCQVLTYISAAAVWARVLKRAGSAIGMPSLLRLALLELFANQAIPTGGLSGSIIVVRGLIHRGVASSVAVTALLVAALSYYAAYLLVGLLAFVLLWNMADLSRALMSISAIFLGVIVLLAGAVIALTRSRGRFIPKAALGWKPVARMVAMFANIRADIFYDGRLIFETIALQTAIFLLDAATLWCAAKAVSLSIEPPKVFISFMMGSVVSTLSPVPMGLGTFEATCTAMLHFLGGTVEASLAATLVLRGFTLWLPMLPGLWFMRHEAKLASEPHVQTIG